jgi:hypothetical protein
VTSPLRSVMVSPLCIAAVVIDICASRPYGLFILRPSPSNVTHGSFPNARRRSRWINTDGGRRYLMMRVILIVV